MTILEKEIEDRGDLMHANELLDKITELIDLKTKQYKTNSYTGYIQDQQRKANALYSLRQVESALDILKQIEKTTEESLKVLLAQKQLSKSNEIECRNQKLEIANTILMRIQMQDDLSSSQEIQGKQSLKDCLQAIQYIEDAGESISDHMVVAQQTLGETYYKIGQIQSSAQAIEKTAYLLDELIYNISNENNKLKKQTEEQKKQTAQTMRHLIIRQAICFETLGNLHFDLRNMQQAESFFTSSLKLWENNLHDINDQNNGNSVNHQQQKLNNNENQNNNMVNLHPLHIRCLNSIGTFYSANGQIIKALQILSNAKRIMHSANVENADNFSWMLLNMAKLYYKQQQYKISLELTIESEDICRQYQISSVNLAQILEHKSSLLTMQGKYKESSECIEEGLSLFKENSTEPIYCRLLFCRGMQCINSEQYEKAIHYAQKSQLIVENTRGQTDEQVADALRIIGMAYCSVSFQTKQKQQQQKQILTNEQIELCEQQFNYGIECLEQAITIFQNHNHTRLQDQEAILGDLARIYEFTKNFKKAIMSYEQQRTVRMHVLENAGLPSNTDQIISLIDEKITSLYAIINPN